MNTAVTDVGGSLHAVETVAGKAETADIGIGLQAGFPGQQVGAAALQLDAAREGACVERRQEVARIQVRGLQVGGIGHRGSIKVHVAAQFSAALGGCEAGLITLAARLHRTFQSDATGDFHAVECVFGQ